MYDLSRDIRRWMFDVAIPFWSDRGVDREHGGFTEQLTLGAAVPCNPYKRTRVIARQIYVFSHAALLGDHSAAAISEMGYHYLVERAWLGSDRGWARRLDARGEVIDETPDLYDLAFVLFALGWRYRVSRDIEALSWADRTLDFIEREMRHPAGGFFNERPLSGFRQQNPHMHLLEAALVLLETTSGDHWRRLADELVELFEYKFYDSESKTLAEYFSEDLRRAAGEAGRVVEPGHQFEWAWILANHGRLTGRDNLNLVRGLVSFAEDQGVNRVSGVTYNQVRDDGAPLDRGSRSWPNTERMKAAVALYDLFGEDPSSMLEQSGRLLLDRYLAVDPPGAWIDAFDEGGRPAVDKIPASTLYHVFLAFSETLRVSEAAYRK